MKKLLTGIMAIAVFTFSATAQSQTTDEINRAERKAQQKDRISPRLLEQLELTTTQSEQMKFINEDYRIKMQEMIKSEMNAEERKVKRTEHETAKRNKILAVLTPDQQKKLRELQRKEMESKESKGSTGEYIEKTMVDGVETKIKVDNEEVKIKTENVETKSKSEKEEIKIKSKKD